MADVVGIGSAFVDYFFESDRQFLDKNDLKPEDDFLFKAKNINPKDIISQLPLLAKSPGGIATNTIAVLAKLGVKTGYYGVIGEDADGDFWLKNIGSIDKSKITRQGKMSFCDCLLSKDRKNRTLLSKVNPLDNTFLRNIDLNYLNKAKVIHIGPLILNPKNGMAETSRLLQGITKPIISFSPSILYIAEGANFLTPIFNKTKILFLNRKEMKYLASHNIEAGAAKLLKQGPEIIVCTLGSQGAYIATLKEQFYVSRYNAEKVVDTTGAGDTFAAGFIYGIIKGKGLRSSALLASKLAAQSLSDFGLNWLNSYDLHN